MNNEPCSIVAKSGDCRRWFSAIKEKFIKKLQKIFGDYNKSVLPLQFVSPKKRT